MGRRPLPNWWAWVVLVVATTLNIAMTTIVTGNLAHRAIDADRRARAEAGEQSRRAVCLVVTTGEKALRDMGTESGRNAADAWHDLGILFRCY